VNWRTGLLTVETVVIWLFFLQAIRVLFTALFGVIYDAVFDASLSMLVVALDLLLITLALLTPLLLRWTSMRTVARLTAVLVVLVARIPLSLNVPSVRLYASIVLLGGAAFYLAHVLENAPHRLMTGFIAGLGAEQFLRAWDYTYDPTLHPGGLGPVIGLAAVMAGVSIYLAREPEATAPDRPPLSVGLALGAALFLQTSLLALPNGLARWSGTSYSLAAPLLLLVTLLPLLSVTRTGEQTLALWLWPIGNLLQVLVIVLSLALAALLDGAASALFFLVTQFTLLLSLCAVVSKKRAPPSQARPSPGLEWSLGLCLFLGFSFAFAFTFTYPYTLGFLRGMGTPVLLAGALIAALSLHNVPSDPEAKPVKKNQVAASLGAVITLVVICALLARPPRLSTTRPDQTLRLATYNIHYGFDSNWKFTLDEIAATIEKEGVDVIVLQEVDAGRVTSLSVDDALWLGQHLGMYVVYQPTLERLSGIALLSRYPLAESDGQWLTSALEQTAIVHAALETTRGPLHVYGIWLGLEAEERATQLTEALDYIGAAHPAGLGGDLNATPDSPIYTRLVGAGMQDPFVAADQEMVMTSPAIDPTERIDYFWLRGLSPRAAWVSDSTASDHRMVVVEVQLDD